MKAFLISLCILILLTSGCINTRKQIIIEDEKPEDEEVKEVSVLEEGRRLLSLPTEDLFFSAFAKHHAANPEDAQQLLQEYKKKQEKLFMNALENKNYSDSWFYHNNLLAFDKPGTRNNEEFYNFLIREYANTGYGATSRYLSYLLGKTIGEIESPYTNVTAFREILVEIYVTIIYEDKYSIKRKDYSFGSGFIINNTQIITAFHIIESCFAVHTTQYEITIKKDDRIMDKVKIKGWDSLTDIALLEIEEKKFDLAIDFLSLLGNSDTLKQGDDIYCLGHHSGLTSTLTKGIISAKERTAPEGGTWIQIDANVAPGASGGMAIGMDRKIYGMIVAGIVYEDLNFIIPSNLLLSVIDRLCNGEQIRRPWIGLLLEEYWDKSGEISIADIFPTSPLHMYNISRGNTLIEINNLPVKSIKDAQDNISRLFAGNLVHVKIKDYSDTKDCWILLERRPDYPIYNATRTYNKLSSLYPHFGFAVQKTDKIEQKFIIQGKTFYLAFYKVSRIRRFSVLDSMGVQIGDHIGFLSDHFVNKTRYIEVLHIPQDKSLKNLDNYNVYDFIYRLSKGAYDENIL